MDDIPRFRVQPKGFATKALHAGQDAEQWRSHCVVPPIVTSATFEQDGPEVDGTYVYGRYGNPTRDVLESCLAALDNGKSGLVFSSGVGAMAATISLLESGDHVICSHDVYGGTSFLLKKQTAKYGIELDFIDAVELTTIKNTIKKNTKMLIVETPSNPLLKILDLNAISEMLKEFVPQQIIFVVDNTFLTPYFQRPLEQEADIVVYSMSKYMNGHSDVVMGATITNCPELESKLRSAQISIGIIPSPFDCYQVNRSLKTLALRMEEHQRISLQVARFLERHALVERVLHPGLPSHPQHQLALKQMYGVSGMMSFYIKGNLENTRKFMKALRLVMVAPSLGGPETLVCVPALVTHVSVPLEERLKMGISDTLIRISVGLEDPECIINDLDQALNLSQ